MSTDELKEALKVGNSTQYIEENVTVELVEDEVTGKGE